MNPHLEFYPEMTEGLNIYKFSQSAKWLKHLSPVHRPPMCDVNGKHFYIFEPVQLKSADVVIPLFFFQYKSHLHAKCLKLRANHIRKTSNEVKILIPKNLGFDDPLLSIVPVDEFDFDYSEIKMGDRRLLMEACRGRIYGKCFRVEV